jgi:hypothetical protein
VQKGHSLREQIEDVLRPLTGLALWGTHRAAGMQVFQFGARNPTITHRGKPAFIGDYGLHLQCPWRIVGPGGIEVGSADLYYSAGDPDQEPADFQWDKPGANRRDERMNRIFAERREQPLFVETVAADTVAGFVLTLTEGLTLEVFPNDSFSEEHWRLLNNIDPGRPHFVVSSRGVDIVPDDDDS